MRAAFRNYAILGLDLSSGINENTVTGMIEYFTIGKCKCIIWIGSIIGINMDAASTIFNYGIINR